MKTEVWWGRMSGGEVKGPFSATEVEDMTAAGLLSAGTEVWSSNGRQWRDEATRPVRRLGRVGWPVAAAALSLIYLPSLGAVISLHWLDGLTAVPLSRLPTIWIGAGFVLAIVSLALPSALWGTARSIGRTELSGLLYVLAGFVALLGLGASAVELRQSRAVTEWAAYGSSLNYLIRPDSKAGLVRIQGMIGPGFAHAVVTALEEAPDPVTIEINSGGGLISEALKAAQSVRARNADVVVQGECYSACMILLAAGAARDADINARIGFHAPASIISKPDRLARWLNQQTEAEADRFMSEAGFPRQLIDEANRRGPDRLDTLTAVEARRSGILSGLRDGHIRLTSEEEALASSAYEVRSP